MAQVAQVAPLVVERRGTMNQNRKKHKNNKEKHIFANFCYESNSDEDEAVDFLTRCGILDENGEISETYEGVFEEDDEE